MPHLLQGEVGRFVQRLEEACQIPEAAGWLTEVLSGGSNVLHVLADISDHPLQYQEDAALCESRNVSAPHGSKVRRKYNSDVLCHCCVVCCVVPCLNTARALIGELYVCMHTVSVTELPMQYNVLGALTRCICTLVCLVQ